MGNSVAQLLFVDIATARVAQIGVGRPRVGAGEAFEAGIGPQAIETEQEPSVQDIARQSFTAGHAGQEIQEVGAQRGFFQHIEQVGVRPPLAHFAFKADQIAWLRLDLQGRERNGFLAVG